MFNRKPCSAVWKMPAPDFTTEASVTGDRKWEDVFAHEIVHQWFGDMASEKTFAHLWLSEGFATYLTDVYFENKYGKEKF